MECANREISQNVNCCAAAAVVVQQNLLVKPNKIHINHDECFSSLMSVDNGRSGELMPPNIGNGGTGTLMANNNTNTTTDSLLELAMEDLLQCEPNLDILQLQNETFCQQNTTLNFPPIMNCKQESCASENLSELLPTTEISGFYPKSSIPVSMTSNQITFDQPLETNELKKTTESATIIKVENNSTIIPEHDALKKLAYNIWQLAPEDHIVLDKKRHEVIRTNAHTNQKTIYRLTDPISMGMKPMSTTSMNGVDIHTPNKPKVGRPRKRFLPEAKPDEDKSKLPKVSGINVATNLQMVEPQATLPTIQATMPQVPQFRTRFGRIVRSSNQHMSTNSTLSKHSQENRQANTNTTTIPSMYQMESVVNIMQPERIVNSMSELLDKDYRPSNFSSGMDKNDVWQIKDKSSQVDMTMSSITNQSQSSRLDTNTNVDSNNRIVTTKRFVPPESICPTCNKVFLGKRLERHFVKNPNHMIQQIVPVPLPAELPNTSMLHSSSNNNNEYMTLFNYLIAKLQNSHCHLNEDQRADFFLNELNDFIEQLQLRSTRLIRNTSGLHFVNARTARVLGIPEGQYALDMNAIELEPDNVNLLLYETTQTVPAVAARNLVDYTTALSMSIDDTLTDEAAQKLNLSAGGKLLPPSEESLLRTVDDFSHMQTAGGITKLSSVSLQLQPPVVIMNNGNVNGNGNIVNGGLANAGIIENGSVVVGDNCSNSSGGGVVSNGGSGSVIGGVNNCVSTVNDNVVNSGNSNSEEVGVGALLSQYVHVSDNAVEAMNMKETTNSTMLDLNVDFFQFNNN